MSTNEKLYVEKTLKNYQEKEVTKIDELKALDKKSKQTPKIFAYVFGSIGALVLGFGMCVAMQVILADLMWLGIIVGIIGIAMVVLNIYLYNYLLSKNKRKYAEQITKLSNEILEVTKLMTRGNFKVSLKTKHTYNDYDAYDMIKEDLNKMAKELSKSEMLKNDFIANVSHEIKTPLAVINSYAKVLSDSSISEDERKKYLHNLQLSCNKLNTLVTNILKLNKLENQKLLPEFTSFNLSELLSDQILQFEELLEKKNIELVCDIEDDLVINSEKNYLEIVFNNLMSNAIKFSHNSGIINISLKKQDDKYTIIFKDNGCGMDSETGKHIFDKFYQADTSHSKEGNGLGLALVKKVIDIIGGKISVESEIGVGTTFTIVIKEV